MNMVSLSVMLIIVGIAVGAWHGLQWLFDWTPGLALMGATLVVTWLAYIALEALVVWMRERREARP